MSFWCSQSDAADRFPWAKSRHPNHTHDGSSVLTERSPGGKYLPWGPGDEPFEKSKAALCDMWAEWEGMQGIVAQEKAKQAAEAAAARL